MIIMPKVYRLGLVRQYVSNQGKNDTPEPFCELRAFIFVDRLPTFMQKRRIRSILSDELDKLEDIIESIGQQRREGTISEETGDDYQKYKFFEILNPTPIDVKMPTRNVRVMIEGYEVENVDLESIFQMGQARYFSDGTERQIAYSKDKFLNLLLNKPQRYFALKRVHGSPFEYDEADIKGRLVPYQVRKRRIVEAREDMIRGLADWRKGTDLRRSVYDIMRIVEEQRKLRG